MSFGPVIGTGSYIIIKEEPVQANDLTYNGTLQSVVWNNFDPKKMKITVDPGEQKNAGTYQVGFKPIKQYCWSNGTQRVKYFEWTVKPKAISAPALTVNTRVYNGDFQSPDISYDPVISQYGDNPADIFIIEHLSEKSAGSYVISWTLNSTNYVWTVPDPAVKTASWTITKKPVAVPTVSDTEKTYNTSTQGPTVVSTDESSWTKTGYQAIDAGDYNLVFSLTDKNNTMWADNSSSDDRTFSWKISALKLTKPSGSPTNFTYNSVSQGPSISNIPSSVYVSMTGELTAVNSGSHFIKYSLFRNTETTVNTQWSDGSTGDVTISYDINVLKISIPSASSTSKVYNTLSQTPGISDMSSFSRYLTMVGDSTAINVGDYTVSYTIKDSFNAENTNVTWSDGSVGTKEISWSITKKTVAKPALSASSFVFSAANISVSAYEQNFNAAYMTRSGDMTGFDVDIYNVVYSLRGNTSDITNVSWSDNSTSNVSLSWHITKKTLTKPVQSGVLTYNGSQQTVTWNSSYDSSFMTVDNDKGTNAGTYTATFTSKYPGNAQFGTSDTVTSSWNISTLALTKPTLSGSPFTYNGSVKTPTRNNENLTYMTRTGDTSGTNAKTYTMTYSLKNTVSGVTNVKWSDNSTNDVSLSWIINKAAASKPTLSKSSIAVTKSSPTATFTVTRDGDGVIGVSSSNSSYVTAAISGTTVTVNGLKDTTSAVTITITVGEGTNYKATTSSTAATLTVTVSGYVTKLSVKSTDITFIGELQYTGSRLTADGSMFKNYDSSTMILSNNTGTNVGDYSATITCKSGYQFYDGAASVTVQWSIIAATFAITDTAGKGDIDIGSCTSDNLPTGTKRFGTASFYCDGNSAHQVTVNNLSSLITGTGDWTVDFWVCGGPNHNSSSTNLIFDVGGKITLSPASFKVFGGTLSGSFVSTEGWTHYALCKTGTTLYYFCNGSSMFQFGFSKDVDFTHNKVIINSAGCSAYIDEFRISKTCRWTANFDYPTSAYTKDSNTVLLLHFDV